MADIELTDLSALNNNDSVFSDQSWLKSIQSNYDYTLNIFRLEDEDNTYIIPVFGRKKYIFKQIVMPLYIPYTAYISRYSDKIISVSGIDKLCKYLSKIYFTGRFSIIVSKSGDDFQKSEYAINRQTYLLDLDGDTFAGYSKSKRKKCRKLLREYDVRTVKEKNLDIFYGLEDRTFGRKNSRPLGNRNQERGFIEDQIDNGNMSQWVFYEGEEITGSKIVINDFKQNTVYAWKGYTDPDYLDKGFSILLTHLMIEESQKDFRYYNFHGANIESFASFKKGFGGELKSYYEFKWTKFPEIVAFAQRIRNDCNIFRL